MTRYQLAKIVHWAGTLDTRKRMQKVVYLLQVMGCPLDVDFELHHFGPYSQEVARLTDEMTWTNLLIERAESVLHRQRFSYQLSEGAQQSLADFERTPQGQVLAESMAQFELPASQLIKADLKVLEFASTIVFFQLQGHDWPEAVEKMCQFKGLASDSPIARLSEDLAHELVP